MLGCLNGATREGASIVLIGGRPSASFRAGRVLSLSQVSRDREVERFRGGALLVHGGPREDAAEEAGEGSRRTEGTTYGSDSGRSRAISAGLRK